MGSAGQGIATCHRQSMLINGTSMDQEPAACRDSAVCRKAATGLLQCRADFFSCCSAGRTILSHNHHCHISCNNGCFTGQAETDLCLKEGVIK